MIVFYTLSYYIIICSNLLYFWFVSYYMLLFHFLNYILLCYIVLEYAISCHNFLVVYYSTSYLFILIYIYIYTYVFFPLCHVLYCMLTSWLFFTIILYYITYIYTIHTLFRLYTYKILDLSPYIVIIRLVVLFNIYYVLCIYFLCHLMAAFFHVTHTHCRWNLLAVASTYQALGQLGAGADPEVETRGFSADQGSTLEGSSWSSFPVWSIHIYILL